MDTNVGGRPTKRTEAQTERTLLLHFCAKSTAKTASEITGISRKTVTYYFKHFRELIFESLRKAPRFAGIVEIDEKWFGRRKKPRKRRRAKPGEYLPRYKYGPERMVQVLAILERNKAGRSRVYTHIIPNVKRRTLSPIIHMIVEGKSTIYTDGLKSYGRLKFSGYKHKAVNHRKKQYVLGPGVHVNSVESFFAVAKGIIKKSVGVPKKTFPLHIKECEFRHNNRGNILPAMKRLIKDRDRK